MGDIRNKIASNIAYFRKRAGYTQKSLAAQIGVASTTVASWEQSAGQPDAEVLYKICEIIGVTLSEMYGIVEEPRQDIDELVEAFHKNPKLGILFSRSSKMSEKSLDAVLNIVELMDKEKYDSDWIH